MNRITVQLAYLTAGRDVRRVLADSRGLVYVDGRWQDPSGRVEAFGAPFERWSDVPSVWLDGCAYWRG